jgi:hypothetical protein
VVGDGEKLYEPLKAIAPVRMVDVDGKSLTPDDLRPKAGIPTLDRAQIATRSDSFQVVVRDQVLGAMTTSVRAGTDSLVYTEHTSIAGGTVQQQTTVRFDPTDLSVLRVDQTGSTQGQAAETHLAFSAGRVTGTSTTPQASGTPQTLEIDTTVAPGTYDDNALNVVLPALPLEAGRTFNLGVFSGGKGQTQVMQVKVSDGDTITVPAGTFPAYRLDISGGQVPIAMYVAKETPRRIVKIEFIGAPFVFELVK